MSKNSKRIIEQLLQQTSATLSGEADERIRRSLGIKDKTMSNTSAYEEETKNVTVSGRSRGSRRSVGITAALTVAAVVCAVLLTVWVKSLRKNPSGNGGVGRDGTTVTPTATVIPSPTSEPFAVTPTISPTPIPSVSPTPKVLYMPSYKGLDYNVAIQKLEALDMRLNIRYEAATEIYEDYPIEGQVVNQIPAVGDPLSEGDSVVLIYSIGQGQVEIGDYRGMTEQQVRSELGSKLAVRIDWVESDTVEENRVVSTNPGAGEKLPLGSTLTVVLSQGSSKYTEVPDVVGMSEVDAKAKLIVAKLDYSTETAYSDTVPAGIVISQSPDSSAGKVEKGTVIKLVISAGEDPE